VGILVQRKDVDSVRCATYFLPELDDTQLRERLSAYLDAYQQRHQDKMAWLAWEAPLKALCHWLGQVFFKPLREALPDLIAVCCIFLVTATQTCKTP